MKLRNIKEISCILGSSFLLSAMIFSGCGKREEALETTNKEESTVADDETIIIPESKGDEESTAKQETTEQEAPEPPTTPAPTTPEAPQPSQAPTTPEAPTTPALTTPEAPQPSQTPTTPEAPQQSQAPTTPEAPQPSRAPTTPEAPPTTPAPTTPQAPANPPTQNPDLWAECEANSVAYRAYYEEVLRLVNGIRAEAGVGPLVLDDTLCRAATMRAVEMDYANVFSHTRPDGSSCFSVLETYGITYFTTGENIAAGYQSPAKVVEGWKNSPGHYANMIKKEFGKLGVGYSENGTGDYNYYWVQMFTD